MREMRLTPCELGKGIIALGRQGESGATRVVIDCAAWLDEHPDAQVKLFLFTRGRGEDDPIVPALKKNGTDRIWLVGSEETKESGSAVIELVLIDSRSGTIKKSATGRVHIAPSPSAGMEGTPPQEPSAPDAPGDEPGEEEKGYVRYDKAQALTEEQKETARSNIGAGTGSGNAGIHIGPEEPEDESVVLWIDTDEEGGSGGGIDEGALLETLESLGLIHLMRDGDNAALADADGAVMTFD